MSSVYRISGLTLVKSKAIVTIITELIVKEKLVIVGGNGKDIFSYFVHTLLPLNIA